MTTIRALGAVFACSLLAACGGDDSTTGGGGGKSGSDSGIGGLGGTTGGTGGGTGGGITGGTGGTAGSTGGTAGSTGGTAGSSGSSGSSGSGGTAGADGGVDPCLATPCLNGGTCASDPDAGAGYVCTCAVGYKGATCSEVDYCAPNPCQNAGTCTDTGSGFTCTCPTGWSGTTCQTAVTTCASTPCQNGATCTDGPTGYTCACVAGFYGANCDTACTQGNCVGTVTCDQAGGGNRTCTTCAAGYSGTDCETNIDDCTPNPCQNGGTCVDGVNSYTCTCPAGYSGTNCETNIDDCTPNPCQNGGTCVDGVNTHTCTCPQGTTGANCQTVANKTCLDIKRATPTATDGIYYIDPDGATGAAPFQALCEMTTNGGGWTLVANRSLTTQFVGTWGTTAVNKATPATTGAYALDFDVLPDAGMMLMRYNVTPNGEFEHTFNMSQGWTSGAAGARRRRVIDNNWYLVLATATHGAWPDTTCVHSGAYAGKAGYSCDGDAGQINGQGLFARAAGNEIGAPCGGFGNGGFKTVQGGNTVQVCNPPGTVSLWFREPLVDCAEYKAFGYTADGAYAIDPDGVGGDNPMNAYCDQTTRGGGYTVVTINGKNGRPASWTGNGYPRPGAAFYGTIGTAVSDIAAINAAVPATTAANYSIGAKTLYAQSAREVIAYVGQGVSDYIHFTLPTGCNFFDGAATCAENTYTGMTVNTSGNLPITFNAQACTTAASAAPFQNDPYDEFGLHILDGADAIAASHCYRGNTGVGLQNWGRIYTTFEGNPPTTVFWGAGVHSAFNESGAFNNVGYLMIR